MFLFTIVNKLLCSPNFISQNQLIYCSHKIKILEFTQKESFSFYFNWVMMLIYIRFYMLRKISYFIFDIFIAMFNQQKLISYIININVSTTNTFINVNTIKGNPKSFISAGMLKFKKRQKTKQPKAVLTILKALFSKFKIFKIKPVALHFNNLFFNQQSYVLKRLKQKIFIKTIITYNYFAHNGCRLKKKKRIKIRTRTKKLKKE